MRVAKSSKMTLGTNGRIAPTAFLRARPSRTRRRGQEPGNNPRCGRAESVDLQGRNCALNFPDSHLSKCCLIVAAIRRRALRFSAALRARSIMPGLDRSLIAALL